MVSFPRLQGLNVIQQHSQVADVSGPCRQAQLVEAGRVGGDELDDMTLVQLSHRHGLLVPVTNAEFSRKSHWRRDQSCCLLVADPKPWIGLVLPSVVARAVAGR